MTFLPVGVVPHDCSHSLTLTHTRTHNTHARVTFTFVSKKIYSKLVPPFVPKASPTPTPLPLPSSHTHTVISATCQQRTPAVHHPPLPSPFPSLSVAQTVHLRSTDKQTSSHHTTHKPHRPFRLSEAADSLGTGTSAPAATPLLARISPPPPRPSRLFPLFVR